MFVRAKPMPSRTRPHRHAVQIVQSRREGKRVRQKILLHCGFADAGDALDRLRALAEHQRLEMEIVHSRSLFSPEEAQRQLAEARQALASDAKTPALHVNLAQLRETQRIVTGVHDVYGAIYDELGLDRLLPPARYRASNRVLRQIVLARLANPCSKRRSVAMLTEQMGVELSLPAVYRMMDHLDAARIAKLNRKALRVAQALLPAPLQLWLFDCTTLYFESFVADDLKQPGYSKDGKVKESQVVLALAVTAEGLPVGYEVFPGKQYEGQTLLSMVQRLCREHGIASATVVADRGMLSKANLQQLRDAHIHYVVGARLKSLPQRLQAQVTERTRYSSPAGGRVGDDEVTLAEFAHGAERLVVSHSSKRARKDRRTRVEAVWRLRGKLRASDRPKQWLTNRGNARYLRLEGESRVALDRARYEAQAQWDGLHGVITDLPSVAALDVLGFYRDLWVVEETFRVTKHDLRARPMFHWTAPRIHAHLAIAFMSLMCVRHLQYRLKVQDQSLSADQIHDALAQVQQSVLEHRTNHRRYAIPSNINQVAQKLYRVTGRTHPRSPYEIVDRPSAAQPNGTTTKHM